MPFVFFAVEGKEDVLVLFYVSGREINIILILWNFCGTSVKMRRNFFQRGGNFHEYCDNTFLMVRDVMSVCKSLRNLEFFQKIV